MSFDRLAAELLGGSRDVFAALALLIGVDDPTVVISRRSDGIVSCETRAAGRWYRGHGRTEDEAAWSLLAVLARRQAEIRSAL